MIPLLAYCNYFYHPPMKTIKCFPLSLPTYYYDITNHYDHFFHCKSMFALLAYCSYFFPAMKTIKF